MILSRISMENKALFGGLVPAHILDGMDREYRFGLGLLAELEGEGNVEAAGAIVFDVSEGSTEDGKIVAAWIQWFYVDEQYRRKGVADRLITEMYAVLKQAGVLLIYVDIPLYEGYNLLCAYLEAWDFVFRVVDRYELLITLGELCNAPRMPKKLISNVCPLSEVSAVQFREYLSKMWKSQETMDSRLTWEKEDYEQQISCCYMEHGQIGGALLIRRVNDTYFEVLHMRMLTENAAALTGLMAYALDCAKGRYAQEAYVSVLCSSQKAGELIDYLFPGHEPLLVRRGIKVLEDRKEEETNG